MNKLKISAPSTGTSKGEIIAFGSVVWPLVIGQQSLTFMLPYYSQVAGLSLATIGIIFTAARIFDAFWDTGIAYISDNTRTRIGRRKPWIIAGLVLFLPAMWLLFVPGKTSNVAYYSFALFFFFTAWTMAYIPILAQASELSKDYVQRNAISMTQSVVTISSLLVGTLLPFLLLDKRTAGLRYSVARGLGFLNGLHLHSVIEFFLRPPITGPARYGMIMLVIVAATSVVMPFTTAAYMRKVHEKPNNRQPPKGSILAAIKNAVFRRFFLSYSLMMLGYMGRAGLTPFIVTFALHATDNLLLLITLTNVTGIVCTPIWSALLKRFERSTVVIAAALVEVTGLIMLTFCGPQSGILIDAAFVVMGLPGLTIMLIPYQIAGDCADYAKWKTRKESRAVHVSLISLTKKFGSIWAAASVGVAALLGFNPRLAVATPDTVHLLKGLGLIVPAAVLLLGAATMVKFPMTRRRQRALQRRIERRDVAEQPTKGGVIPLGVGEPLITAT